VVIIPKAIHMHAVRHTLLITAIITCQSNPGLLFAQGGSASLVSMSRDADDEQVSTKETTYNADHFLSYALNASPAKLSLARLAAERGSCEEIRDLGIMMMKEEDEVAKKVKVLAAKRSIYPPHKFDANALNEFGNLHEDVPAEFDKQFVVRAISVLEKDVDMLRHATECEDRWVRLLASERLPLVEQQLAQLRFIRERATKGD